MADVMEMHSEMTKEIGSTATDTGRLRYCMRGASPRCSMICEPSIGFKETEASRFMILDNLEKREDGGGSVSLACHGKQPRLVVQPTEQM